MRLSRRAMLRAGLSGLAAALVAGGPVASRGFGRAGAAPISADDLPADVAWRWFEALYDVIKAESIPPTRASRIFAIASVTLYESVVDSTTRHRSLAGQLNGLVRMRRSPDDGGRPDLVAAVALAQITRKLLPAASAQSLGLIEAAERDSEASVGASASEYEAARVEASVVASAIATWAGHDGSGQNTGGTYIPSDRSGGWQPTPPAFNPNPLDPRWGFIRPMVLRSGEELPMPGRPHTRRHRPRTCSQRPGRYTTWAATFQASRRR